MLALVTNVPLVAGYSCYGLFTVAMVLALREGELSKLYPDHRADLCLGDAALLLAAEGYPESVQERGHRDHRDRRGDPGAGRGTQMTPLLVRSIVMVFLAWVVGSFGAVFLKLGALRLNRNILSFVNSRLFSAWRLYWVPRSSTCRR